jgi:predicted nuclease of restriction endonuclease-like RecB superfamily
LGLRKLVDDRCTWESAPAVDPVAIRREVFLRAAAHRRALDDGFDFDRARVVEESAAALDLAPDAIESGLFADLRDAQRLVAWDAIAPSSLVEAYREGQTQAVLLRATRVVVDLERASPAATRALFRKLKFLRLLFTIERRDDGGHRLTIDGPLALFDAVTKYGLQLAQIVPALRCCEAWSLEADVRWGADRKPLVFKARGALERTTTLDEDASADGSDRLPDDIATMRAALSEAVETHAKGWKIGLAQALLDLPGVGLCVPDLVATNAKTKQKVFVERLGYWSRDAVWKRVELVERGLADPIVFVVSSRLRVSAEVLDESASGALYVYKGTPSARALWEKIVGVADRKRAGKTSRSR